MVMIGVAQQQHDGYFEISLELRITNLDSLATNFDIWIELVNGILCFMFKHIHGVVGLVYRRLSHIWRVGFSCGSYYKVKWRHGIFL